jgi:hypothetical protein
MRLRSEEDGANWEQKREFERGMGEKWEESVNNVGKKMRKESRKRVTKGIRERKASRRRSRGQHYMTK